MIKMIQKKMNKKGFTLVELIIVIAVMAILAAIVVPRMAGITEAFSERADKRSMESISKELAVQIQLGNITTGAAAANNVISTTAANVSLIMTTMTDTPKSTGATNFQAMYNGGTLTVSITPANAKVPNLVLTGIVRIDN